MKTTFVATPVASLALLGCQATATEPAKPQTPSVPIHQAAYKGSVDIIKQHLAAGTAVDSTNQYGSTPLHYAARSGKANAAKLLIASQAKVNLKDSKEIPPLHMAASGGRPEGGLVAATMAALLRALLCYASPHRNRSIAPMGGVS